MAPRSKLIGESRNEFWAPQEGISIASIFAWAVFSFSMVRFEPEQREPVWAEPPSARGAR